MKGARCKHTMTERYLHARSEPGVFAYLVHELYARRPADVDFYLPQLLQNQAPQPTPF